jgi:16S rRNA (uracil1498-N3)-methyltransferase
MSGSRLHHRRFFVPPTAIRDGQVEFAPTQTHQLVHVLRLQEGDQVSVFDGTGREVIVSLERTSPRLATGRVLREVPGCASLPLAITLAQVVPRGAAMDLIVAKATELGVTRIVPLEAEQSVRRASGRSPRWSRIVQESAEQCGRRELAEVAPMITLAEFLPAHPPGVPLVACHAGEGVKPLTAVCLEVGRPVGLTLLVGGEGGLRAVEVEALRSHGARLASLGPRLLRTETAALTALAILQATLGDLAAPVRVSP